MLKTMLSTSRIQLVDNIENWEQAIDLVCKPVIESGDITSEYQQAIITSTKDIGPYYVLGPQIAMPHARPEEGVINNALSLLVVKNGVSFYSSENDPVKIILLLAANNSNQHIELITKISEFFCSEDDINTVISSSNKDQIISVLSKY
ncbi:PTS sugar transporter subunit IIA [Photobacterium damselae]